MAGYVFDANNNLDQVHQKIESTLVRLEEVWDAVGFTHAERANRRNTAVEMWKDLCNRMVAEEEQMQRRIEAKVTQYGASVNLLRQQLHMEQFEVDGEFALLPLSELLKAEDARLAKIKDERLEKLRELQIQDQELSRRLNVQPIYLSSFLVPSEAQLSDSSQHVQKLKQDLLSRRALVDRNLRAVERLLDSVRATDREQLQELMTDLESAALTDDTIALAEDLMKTAMSLHQSFVDEMWSAAVELRDRLQQSWKKCRVPFSERDLPSLRKNTLSPSLLERYKSEVAKWESFYSERRRVFDKLEEWQTLWEEKLSLSLALRDPGRFRARGGVLQTQLKREAALDRELRLAEDEMRTLEMQVAEAEDNPLTLEDGTQLMEYIETRKQSQKVAKPPVATKSLLKSNSTGNLKQPQKTAKAPTPKASILSRSNSSRNLNTNATGAKPNLPSLLKSKTNKSKIPFARF